MIGWSSGPRASHGGAVRFTGPLAEIEELVARDNLRGFQTRRTNPRARCGRKPLAPGVWARDYPNGCIHCKTTERNHHCHGLCSACYNNWISHGKPITSWGSPNLGRFPAAVPRGAR